jgi:hypothetical protein
MIRCTRRVFAAVCAVCMLVTLSPSVRAAETIKALIIDGQNNHDFEHTTPWLKAQLEKTGRFTVDVSRTPAGAPRLKPGEKEPAEQVAKRKSEWGTWRPEFSKYQVVVLNYNGENWPTEVNEAFEKYVSSGGGVFVVHAGNNPFASWPAFNQMIGLGWRDAKFGKRVIVDNDGKVIAVPAGEGPGSGHGSQHAYKVIVRDTSHPVIQGLPTAWMHPKDELYHGQRGPAENMHIFATAYSAKAAGGDRSTEANEPLVWWIPFGQGKVFTCLLGHVGKPKAGEQAVLDSQRDTAFVGILTRGCEWAATGKVTIALPAKLPTETQIELAPD